ncbi:MAG TPA: 2-dehydropantoate 2-reductase, partial [Marinobacterium sp.]|nr:2-dehydropantoate 2-reductase [Marinobacterium sp.]
MWHILGVGAIGMRWARKLVLADERVELILRNEQKLNAFTDAGSGVHFLKDEQKEFIPFAATHVDAPDLAINNLILCTKSYSLLEAFLAVRSRLHPHANLVLLCNGYGPQQEIAAQAPELRVWGASTTNGANTPSPFMLNLAGDGETLVGALNDPAKHAPCPLLNLPRHKETSDIEGTLWRKLAINACINPLTALHGVTNGALARDAELYRSMSEVAEEIEELATQISKPLFDQPLAEAVRAVCLQTENNRSSMLDDYTLGRATEIREI